MPQLKSIWQNKLTEAALRWRAGRTFFLAFQVIELLSPTRNPYTGSMDLHALPAVMLLGLALVPIGYLRSVPGAGGFTLKFRTGPNFPFRTEQSVHRRAFLIIALGTWSCCRS